MRLKIAPFFIFKYDSGCLIYVLYFTYMHDMHDKLIINPQGDKVHYMKNWKFQCFSVYLLYSSHFTPMLRN